MEKLYESAARGDVEALRHLLQKDTFLLERVSYTTPNNTPLHIASLKGHLPYVEEILRVSPHLAEELDSQQSSPLHVASALGNVEVARRLVGAAPDMCLSRDSRGRNPVHVAAIKGRVELLEELVSRAPPAARQKVGRGLTAMHLCVEHGQLPALKVLVREVKELINAKNDDGDTILHMAVMGKKTEIMEYLFEAPQHRHQCKELQRPNSEVHFGANPTRCRKRFRNPTPPVPRPRQTHEDEARGHAAGEVADEETRLHNGGRGPHSHHNCK